MMLSRFAIICGLSIGCVHSAFGQDPLAPSLHESVAAMEARSQAGINPFQTPANAWSPLSPHATGEILSPPPTPPRETVPSSPISLSRWMHKVPRGAKSAFQKASKWEREGKIERALEEFRRATTLDPDYAEAHCDLGVLYLELQRYAEAETEFRRAVELTPELSGMHSNLGWALAMQGKVAQAEASAREALRIWNGNDKAHWLLARILAAAPQTQPEAIEHWEAAVALLSGNVGLAQRAR